MFLYKIIFFEYFKNLYVLFAIIYFTFSAGKISIIPQFKTSYYLISSYNAE